MLVVALMNAVRDKACFLHEVIPKDVDVGDGYSVTSLCVPALERINSGMRGFYLTRKTEAVGFRKRKLS